jgi:hypothetical protein
MHPHSRAAYRFAPLYSIFLAAKRRVLGRLFSQRKPRANKQDGRSRHAACRLIPCTTQRPSAIYHPPQLLIVSGRTSNGRHIIISSRWYQQRRGRLTCPGHVQLPKLRFRHHQEASRGQHRVPAGPRCRLAEPTSLTSVTRLGNDRSNDSCITTAERL